MHTSRAARWSPLPVAFLSAAPLVLGQSDGPPSTDDDVAPAGPSVVWDFVEGDYRFDELALGEGVVFALDRRGKVHALDAAEGEVLWTTEGEESFRWSFGLTAVKRDELDAVVVGCDTGLVAFDRATGEEVWRTLLAKGVAGPACADETIVAASADGHAYGFDVSTGDIVWRHDYVADRPEDPPGFPGADARFEGRAARPRAATTDGTLVVFTVFDQSRAIAVEAKDGRRRWAFQTRGWTYGRPTIAGDTVFVGSQDKHLYAVDKATGQERWRVPTGARIEASACALGGKVYFGSCDAHVYAVDVLTGEVDWKYETERPGGRGGPIYGEPVVLDDTVYLGAMRGKVYALERATGALRWSHQGMADSEINSDLLTDGERLFFSTRMDRDKGESTVVAITR